MNWECLFFILGILAFIPAYFLIKYWSNYFKDANSGEQGK